MINVITRWRINQDDAQRIVRDAATALRSHGATGIRIGRIVTGDNCGQTTVIVSYPDWQTFGAAQTAQHSDKTYQQRYNEALKTGELLNRTIVVEDTI